MEAIRRLRENMRVVAIVSFAIFMLCPFVAMYYAWQGNKIEAYCVFAISITYGAVFALSYVINKSLEVEEGDSDVKDEEIQS